MTLKHNLILLDAFILALIIFTIDLQMELGVAGVPYMASVLLCMWIPHKRAVLIIAVTCTFFTIVGYMLSKPYGEAWKCLANRGLALFAIWSTTIVCILRQKSYDHMNKTAELLKEANDELQQFAYVVSHDIRSPLRAIRGYTDFLIEDLGENIQQEANKYLEALKLSTKEAEDLVSGLLALSRIEDNEDSYHDVDVKKVTTEIISFYKDIENVDVDCHSTNLLICTIPVLFRQVIMNLIQNGIKFNDSKNKCIEIGWEQTAANRFKMFIKDNGIGIDEKFHGQIFKLFRRLHTSKEYEGTGIGMAIVKKAMAKLKGEISLNSTKGQGCQVILSLPMDIRT